MSDEKVNDQVLFWQRLIQWWKANQDGPVPERMYEALKLAEERQALLSNRCGSNKVRH